MNSEKFGGIASTDFNDLNLVDNNPTEENQGFDNLVDETEIEGVDRAKLEDRGEETLSAYEVAKTNFEKVEEEYKQKREILDRYREELENADDNWHKYLSEEAIKVAEQSVAEISEAYQKAYQELVAAKGDVKEMNEADKPSEKEINGLIELAKSNKGSAQVIQLAITFAAMAAVTGLTVAFGLFGGGKDKAPAESSEPRIEEEAGDVGDRITSAADERAASGEEEGTVEQTALTGELSNGTKYDYTEYADRAEISELGENWQEEAKNLWGDDYRVINKQGKPWGVTAKETWNAYGYDYSEDYGDKDASIEHILSQAEKSPEILASYAYYLFSDVEKEALGINNIKPSNAANGITMADIDNYLGDDEKGGELRAKLLEKLEEVLNDEETSFDYYKENGTESTNYIYFEDENGDGNMDPTEVHLGYSKRKRNNAPQVDIIRKGKKAMDLNMECGYQPNTETPPTGIPEINPDDPTPTPTPTPTPPINKITPPEENKIVPPNPIPPTPEKEWGKSGDPHGEEGQWQVDPSGPVDPAAEVSKIENDKTNQGNQGYIDDNQATPGAGSEVNNSTSQNNGFAESGIVAEGATTQNTERLSGGEVQGGSATNGENIYNPIQENIAGQAFDEVGNAAQEQAQENLAVGGDNYSNEAEEQIVAGGNF